MPLIGLLWLTNCIVLPFLKFFPLWRLFFFLPAMLRSDIEPLPVGVLSCLTPVHIFAVPSPPPPDNELLTEYIIRAVVLFVVVLASKKRDELLMMTDKKERGEQKTKKSSIFRNAVECCSSIKRPANKTIKCYNPMIYRVILNHTPIKIPTGT